MGHPDPDRLGNDESFEIADAADLLGSGPQRPASAPRPAARPADLGGYDLADAPEPAVDEPPRPPVSPAPPRPGRPHPERPERPEAESAVQPASVSQVWSRGAEWGPNLPAVIGSALATLIVVYLSLDIDNLGRTFFLLVLGLAATLVLSYPILITLERPVRITPEQALQDYYGALSHLLPHHRRMWLLLSDEGRSSAEFEDFATFRAYWKRRVGEIRANGDAKGPLEFRVVDYKADKSAGKDALRAKYSIQVGRAAGGEGSPPIATYRGSATLSKGPDRMWYLDDGTLPGGEVAG